ncbi:hypothetical protein F4806DRAFT_503918 [Annulohypoxylon nitens]|nr:hypothetical protein F4806DRAFT_503918 [Annulohypoxylon nitens]
MAENHTTCSNVHAPMGPVTSAPTNEPNQNESIHQSISSIHESQSDNNNYDVFLDINDSSESDEEDDETESRPSMSSTNIIESTRLQLRESLGISGCSIIVGGTLGSLISLSFLIFLWTAHSSSFGAEDSPIIWRRIMLNGWMGQATTISALVIRFLTTLQATVCTAMLASMFLERRYVRKADIIQFSVIRAINDGPQRLTGLVFSLPRVKTCIEVFLTLSLTLGNLALQFTSSILFSDIHVSSLVGFSNRIQIPSYSEDGLNSFLASSTETEQPSYRMIGEVESNMSSVPDTNGFSDSGWKQRAILPLKSVEERTTIRTFQGNAAVVRSRVSCMRPNMDSIITNSNETDFLGEWVGLLNGTVDYGSSLLDAHHNPSLCNYQGCFNTSLDCFVRSERADVSDRFIGGFCFIGQVGKKRLGDSHIGYQDSDESWSNHSMIYLLYSTNMVSEEWSAFNTTRNLSSFPSNSQGEWKSFEIIPGRFLNISLCFLANSIDSKLITMKAKGNLHEPDDHSTLLSTIWNSSDARAFLGVNPTRQTHAERGILTITDLKEPEHNSSDLYISQELGYKNVTMVQKTYLSLDYGFYFIMTWQMGGRTHYELKTLLEDTLLTTGRAAEALLCFTTSLALTWYNDFLPRLGGTVDADVGFTQNVQTAYLCEENGCKGLVSVITILGLYLLTVFIITILFIRRASYSRQGNAWHTVSQLMGSELQEAFQHGNDKSDEDMDEWTKEDGKYTFVRLEKVDGRVQVVKKRETPTQGKTKPWKNWPPRFRKKKALD